MSRYFFDMVEDGTKKRVRDLEGASFRNINDAQKEAIGLAQDIRAHGLHGSTWQVSVTDENGHTVLTVPVGEVRLRKMRAWFDLAFRIVSYEPRLPPHVFTWLLAIAVSAMFLQALLSQRIPDRSDAYSLASAATEGAVVYVRFAPQASLADIGNFLGAYDASLLGKPQPGGLYRVRISQATLPREQQAKIVRLMAREKIVAFVAAGQ